MRSLEIHQPFGNYLGWSEHGRSGSPALGSGSQKSTKSSTDGRWSLSDGYGKGVDRGDMDVGQNGRPLMGPQMWKSSLVLTIHNFGVPNFDPYPHDEFMSFCWVNLRDLYPRNEPSLSIIFIPCHGWSIFPIDFRNKPMTIFWVRPEMGIPIDGHFSGNYDQLPDLDGTLLLGVRFQLQVEQTTIEL